MIDIAEYPLLLLAVAAVALWLAARGGVHARKWRPLDDDMRQDFSVLLGAGLTLLAMIIGFSFSMASGRYDQRKNYEEAEANAIGTEYARAYLLPGAVAAKLRPQLKAFLDQRILFFTSRDDGELRRIAAETARLQTEMWNAVLGPAAATPTPIVGLAVAGMNDVLNAQGYTQAAFLYRIPSSAWALMGFVALCCNFLVGYGLRSATTAGRLLSTFPLFIAIAFGFIADIDSPRRGVIRVVPQNLIALASSLSPS